jgi:hypothetical protein
LEAIMKLALSRTGRARGGHLKVVLQGLLAAVLLNSGVARAYAAVLDITSNVPPLFLTEGVQPNFTGSWAITNSNVGLTITIASETANFAPVSGDTSNDLIRTVSGGSDCLGVVLAPGGSCTSNAVFTISSGVGDTDVDSALWSVSLTVNGQAGGSTNVTISDAAPATPLPAALPLFATGLGALGLLGWRRKRKARAG